MPDQLTVQLSASTVRAYARVAISTSINVGNANPDDPSQIEVWAEIVSPTGRTIKLPAFWFQDYVADEKKGELRPRGEPQYLVRFAPLEAGEHKGVVHAKAGGRTVTGEFTIRALEPAATHPGYVIIDPKQPRYFRRARTGEAWYAVGGHLFERILPVHAAPGEGDFGPDGPTPRFLYQTHRKLMSHLEAIAKAGVNAVRVRADGWWIALELETRKVLPLPGFPKGEHGFTCGRYYAPSGWMIDQIIERCDELGIAVQLCTWNPNTTLHWGMRLSDNPIQYATYAMDPANEDLVKRRLRYQVARWSAYTSLAAWEFFNEIGHGWNRTGGFDIHDDYWRGITAWLRDVDPYDHLVTNSREGIDIRDVHAYLDDGNFFTWTKGKEMEEPFALFTENPDRPFQLGEYGYRPEKNGQSEYNQLDRIRLHIREGLWCGIVSGKAGVYPWRARSLDRAGQLEQVFAPAAAYLKDEQLGAVQWQAATFPQLNTEELFATGMIGDGHRALLYIVRTPCNEADDRKPLKGATVRAGSLRPGQYLLSWWSVETGQVVHRTTLTIGQDGVASLPLPEGVVRSIAAKLTRAD